MRIGSGPRDRHRSFRHPGGGAQEAQRHRWKRSESGSALKMSLLVVGSVAFDAVETPHGKVDRMLGGAATYFSVAASFFTHVNLVGIVGTDFTEKDAAIFKGRKVDTLGLERADGKTFFWAVKYSENMNERTTLVTALNVFADFKPKLPDPYLSSQNIFLANIHPELQSSVLHQVTKRPKIVALDTMNYWIE